MSKKICDRCNSIIECGVQTTSDKVFPDFYDVNIQCYMGDGRYSSSGSRKLHLCHKCGVLLKSFIDNECSHVQPNINPDDYQYVESAENTSINSTVNGLANKVICDRSKGYDMSDKDDNEIPVLTKYPKSNAIQIGIGLKGIKSEMSCGNIHFYSTKIFSKLEKKMWRHFFGVSITDFNKDIK